MNKRHLDLTLRMLDGVLKADERAEFEGELRRSDRLRAEVDALSGLRGHLRAAAQADAERAAQPFLADRVMRRLVPATARRDDLAQSLGFLFRPVAAVGLLLAVLLAGYNVHLSQAFGSETTAAEAILALPPVSTASVYDLDVYLTQPEVMP